MTSRQNNKNELILVAIDVAKHSHEVLILWPDGHQKVTLPHCVYHL